MFASSVTLNILSYMNSCLYLGDVSICAGSTHEEPGEMADENRMVHSLSLLYSWSACAHTYTFFSLLLSYTSKLIPAPTDHSHSLSSVFIAGAWETAGIELY